MKKTFPLALALAGIGAFALAGCSSNNDETIANVGTSSITRSDLGRFLEAQSGEQALPYLIDTQLLLENAKSKGIEVSDADVEAELARRQQNDPSVAELLKDNPLRTEVVKNQIRRDLTVQRLLTAEVQVDEAKLKTFFEENRAFYDTPGKVQIGLLLSSQKNRADAMARALQNKTKTFEQLVDEQLQAQDPAAQGSSKDRGTLDAYDNFGPAGDPGIRAVLEKTPKGGVTNVQTVPVGPNQNVYAIFKIVNKQEPVKASLETLRPVVETDFKMYQVAVEEIRKNPSNPQDVKENLRRVSDELRSGNPNNQPTMRDILTYILRPRSETTLSELRTAGTVTIADATYSKIGETYKPATPTAAPGTTAAPGATAAPGSTPAAGANAPATGATPAATVSPNTSAATPAR